MNPRVFHKNTIEFITVSKEYVAFCEDLSPYEPQTVSSILHRLLPLIYLKTSLLPTFEAQEGLLEDVVSEEIYNLIAAGFEEKFGEMDLDCDIPEINSTNNEKNTAPLSEILADLYQDLKNVVTNYQSGDELIMESSLYICRQNFELFWGQRLPAALQTLHILNYMKGDWWNDLKPKKTKKIDDVDTSQWIIKQRQKDF
ncbi:MAG TPA: DUF5063 domain-containing protein [Bacteroidales bacterium]|jgi:hypothetical protein|nr:DUF5063 domain-containing protein [Bacteroidales bacterium]HOU97920.1 DUF5063 domain-containing protein [Bacteroidales bacterium]